MQHPSKPLAKTRQGTLAGSAEQGIHIWRGIPYAAPPWAALARAAASRPLAGVRPAETFPPPAGRTLTTAASSAAAIPAPSAKTAYISTSGPGQRSAAAAGDGLAARRRVYHRRRQPAAYDGKALASRDVVVVTVNYRLGHLGFSPIRRWKKRRANVSIISRCSIRLPLCSGFRRISTPSAGMPPTSRCLANPPGAQRAVANGLPESERAVS